jgi:hypothetical protein
MEAGAREVHPIRDGVAGLLGRLVFRSLHHDRRAGKEAVVAAVVEMKVSVDDEN